MCMIVKQGIGIKASVEKAFSFLLEVENRKMFIPALEEVILIDPLPLTIGSKYIEVASIAGRKLKTTYQITDLKENEKLSARTVQSIFPIEVDLYLRPVEDQSIKLNIVLHLKLKGIFKFAEGIIRNIVTQQASEILIKMKRAIENASR